VVCSGVVFRQERLVAAPKNTATTSRIIEADGKQQFLNNKRQSVTHSHFSNRIAKNLLQQQEKNLLVGKGGNTGKDLALHKLEGGTAAGRDVGHVTGTAGLLAGGDGVTTANDGDGAIVLR